MTQEQFDKLIEYVDAAIRETLAGDTSDGGLAESAVKQKLHTELETLLVTIYY